MAVKRDLVSWEQSGVRVPGSSGQPAPSARPPRRAPVASPSGKNWPMFLYCGAARAQKSEKESVVLSRAAVLAAWSLAARARLRLEARASATYRNGQSTIEDVSALTLKGMDM